MIQDMVCGERIEANNIDCLSRYIREHGPMLGYDTTRAYCSSSTKPFDFERGRRRWI